MYPQILQIPLLRHVGCGPVIVCIVTTTIHDIATVVTVSITFTRQLPIVVPSSRKHYHSPYHRLVHLIPNMIHTCSICNGVTRRIPPGMNIPGLCDIQLSSQLSVITGVVDNLSHLLVTDRWYIYLYHPSIF